MELDKIIISIHSLNKQKIIEDKGCSLCFYDTYLIYRLKFRASEPTDANDLELPWHDVDNDFEILILRKQIAGLEKIWEQGCRRWKIIISVDGVGDDVKLYFKKQLECENMYKKLFNYITNGD